MRCLVVEDDADIRDDLRRALDAAGFTVDAVGDGESAWYRGDVEDYDAAILDLGRPRLDGRRGLRRWRRGAGRVSTVVSVGPLRLDTVRMTAAFDGAPARLSPLEFRLLDYLAHQPGRAVSAGELAEHLYGATDSGDANAIEAIVARLRRKFGAGIVATRRGFGYLLETTS